MHDKQNKNKKKMARRKTRFRKLIFDFLLLLQERKTATPIRRQSINQISSPNAGTVVYRPSPTQSPATATTIGPVGNEFNTTLVGSNNISLNKVCAFCSELTLTRLKFFINKTRQLIETVFFFFCAEGWQTGSGCIWKSAWNRRDYHCDRE